MIHIIWPILRESHYKSHNITEIKAYFLRHMTQLQLKFTCSYYATCRMASFSTSFRHPSLISAEGKSWPDAVVLATTLHSPIPWLRTSLSRSAVNASGINPDRYKHVQKWFPREQVKNKNKETTWDLPVPE